jgi:hypothetical protein
MEGKENYREYRFKERSILGFLWILLMVVALYVFDPLATVFPDSWARLALALLPLAFFRRGVPQYHEVRLRFYAQSVQTISLAGSLELSVDEIECFDFKVTPKRGTWLQFVSKSSSRKNWIEVPFGCEGYEAALAWARSHQIKARAEILDQFAVPKASMKPVFFISAAATVCFLVAVSSITTLVVLLTPWVFSFITYRWKTQLWPGRQTEEGRSGFTLGAALVLLLGAMVFILMGRITLADRMPLMIPAGLLSLALGASLWFLNSHYNLESRKFVFIVAMVYGFSSASLINCVFDSSIPSIQQTRVIGKRVEVGKGGVRHYFLLLGAFSDFKNDIKVRVSQEYFESKLQGDLHTVEVRTGFLGTSWISK